MHLKPSTVALLRKDGYAVDAMRVRHLLTHTSGLYDYAEDEAFQTFVFTHRRHHWTRDEQVRFAISHGKPSTFRLSGFSAECSTSSVAAESR
jgi:D-alanyl-D-alanine carboxypeptidase